MQQSCFLILLKKHRQFSYQNSLLLQKYKITSSDALLICKSILIIFHKDQTNHNLKSKLSLDGGNRGSILRSEYLLNSQYVSYSPYQYELKRIKTHEMRAKHFRLILCSVKCFAIRMKTENQPRSTVREKNCDN